VWKCDGTEAGQATAEAIRARQPEIAEEVLATKMDEAAAPSPKFEDETLGLKFTLTKR